MTTENGIRARVGYIEKELERLWNTRASNEAVKNVADDVTEIKTEIHGLRASFRDLMKAILVACVVWALGSAGFIIGVLMLVGGQS